MHEKSPQTEAEAIRIRVAALPWNKQATASSQADAREAANFLSMAGPDDFERVKIYESFARENQRMVARALGEIWARGEEPSEAALKYCADALEEGQIEYEVSKGDIEGVIR